MFHIHPKSVMCPAISVLFFAAALVTDTQASRIKTALTSGEKGKHTDPLRNIVPHQKEKHSSESVQSESSDVVLHKLPESAQASLIQAQAEGEARRRRSSSRQIKEMSFIESWVSSLASAPPSTGTMRHDSLTDISKNHRPLLVAGIAAFLIFVFCCSCCMMDRFFGGGSKKPSRSKAHSEFQGTTIGARQQHLHENRLIYEWDQSDDMAFIYIKPPAGLKQRDLEIKISAKLLKVGRTGKPPFLREEIFATVDEEASSWRIRSNGELLISLAKAKEQEWPYVLVHKQEEAQSWSQHSPRAPDRSPRSVKFGSSS
jgi:hypothetical protein